MTEQKTNRIEVISEGTEWESLQIRKKWETWTIDPADRDGDVEIMADEDRNGSVSLFLNQEELKQVIAFLQKQVK